MNYVLKLQYEPDNSANDCVVNPKYFSFFEVQFHITSTIAHFQATGIDVESISNDSAYWYISLVSPCSWCEIGSHKAEKYETNPEQDEQLFHELSSLFQTTVRCLLMVLNPMKKLLEQRLQIATLKSFTV